MTVRESRTRSNLLEEIESGPCAYSSVHLDRDEFVARLSELEAEDDIAALRQLTTELKRTIASDDAQVTGANPNGNVVSLRRDVLTSELDQILADAQPRNGANVPDGDRKLTLE